MDLNKVDKTSLENIKQFDHLALLDCIEHVDYIEKLFAPGPNGESSALKTQLLSLFHKVEKLKQEDKECTSDVWSEAIESDDTLWAAGTACHEVIVVLFKLLQCNPDLACQYIDDIDSDEEEDN